MLHPELVQRMKSEPESEMIGYHFGLGMWIRNQWGHWGDSRLEQYFTNIGVSHPDDMSGVILDSFWRHLNSAPLRVEEQIEHYREYWRMLKEDEKGAGEDKR